MARRSSQSKGRRRSPRWKHRIIVVDRSGQAGRAADAVHRAVRKALRVHSVRNADVVVSIVTDREMARLHRQYLGRRGPTDVLAFDMRDTRPNRRRLHGAHMEGEVVVSYETADREARRRHHALAAELALYALHGTLHLLGYDDRSPRQAQHMHSMEDRLLVAMGFGATFTASHQPAARRGRGAGRALRLPNWQRKPSRNPPK